MRRSDARFLNAFRRAPPMTKVAVMARTLVNGEQALPAVAKLIALVVLMASCLSIEARVAIAAQLRDEADLLAPPPERRAMH